MKYEIIYADPPWRHRGRVRSATVPYPTMSIEDIAALPIAKLAAPNCALFLWATYPLLAEALRAISAWGFEYKSIAFQWVKLNPKTGTPFFGLGRWTRGNTEPCLLATRGRPKRVSASVTQLIQSPVRHHSAKPPEVRERIVDLMGDIPRLELFARERAEGWHSTGLDLDGVPVQDFLGEGVRDAG